MEAMQAFLNFRWLQKRDGLVKSFGLEVEQERDGDRLQIAHAFRRLDRTAGKNARAEGLGAKRFGELRREFLQAIRVFGLAMKRESQLAHLCEVAVINLQALDRGEAAREQIQDFGVEPHPGDEDEERCNHDGSEPEPNPATPLGNESANERMKRHRGTVRELR